MSVLKKIVMDQIFCLLWRRRHWVYYYKLLLLPTAGDTNSHPHREWRGDVNQRSFQSLTRGRDRNYGNTQSGCTVSAQTPLLYWKVNQHDHMFGIFHEKMNIGIFGRNISLLSDREFSFRNYRTLDSTNKGRTGQICQRATSLRPVVHIKQLLDSSLLAQVDLQESQLACCSLAHSASAGVPCTCLSPTLLSLSRHHITTQILSPLSVVALSSDVSSINSSFESAQMKWPGPLRREMLYISHRCCPTSFSDTDLPGSVQVIICAAGMT